MKRKQFFNLDRRDELVLALFAGIIPLLSLATMAHSV